MKPVPPLFNGGSSALKKIKTLIIGTTALACGMASVLGADCIVVSRDSSAGAEFVDAMNAARVDVSRLGAAGQSLADELKSRGILNDNGETHILALSGVLARLFLESGCEMLLGASVISVVRTSDGFSATVFTPSEGYMEILAANVLDTTVRPFMDCRKTFGVMLAGETALPCEIDGVKLQKGFFPDEFILRFEVEKDATIPDAERSADEWLIANRDKLGKARAASIALFFGWEFGSPLDFTKDGVRYIPSASYSDAVSAFDGGASICL